MAVQFRLIDNRRQAIDVLREFENEIADLKKKFYKGLVRYVVQFSPVDTGTYMDEHNVLAGRSGSTRAESSHGKPRKQPRGPFQAQALSRMFRQIDALSGELDEVVIANFSAHAKYVEHGKANSSGHLVYKRTRAMSLTVLNSILRTGNA